MPFWRGGGNILAKACSNVVYKLQDVMIVETTDEFDHWLRRLKDRQARGRILDRIARLRDRGHFGDVRTVGGAVREMRINIGPGYRLYFVQRGTTVVVLLCGGDKGSQDRDIAAAKSLAEGLD